MTPPLRLRSLLTALLALPVLAGAVGAQSIRGRVLRSVDQSPLVGVVVLLLDDQSEVRSRTLSSAQGLFVLRAPSPGTYRIQTLRIGFRAHTTDPIALRSDTAFTLSLDQLPVQLPSITAQETASCRENPERSLATAILWEEAKTAILAADITIRELDYQFDVMLHSRKYDTRSPPLLLESVFLRERHRGTRPWSSLPPDTLERRGYVSPTDSGLRYVAPDLEVLLSPYFTRTHCFRMRDSTRTPVDRLALEFWPVATIMRPEIRGVLWFDRRSRALQAVAYSYVNLPATVRDTAAGGEIAFAQLPNGAWILPRWLIRAPIPVRGQLADTVRRAGSAVNVWSYLPTTAPQTARLRVTGGDLLAVSATDAPGAAPLWTRPVSSLEVTVVTQDEAGEQPVPGATIGFAGSTTQEVTDNLGVARFSGLIEGEWVIEGSTPMYSALRVRPEMLPVRFGSTAEMVRRKLVLRTLPDLVAQACGLDTRRAALVGSVIKDGSAVRRSPVVIAPLAGSPAEAQFGTAETVTGVDGRYAVCNMPVGFEFLGDGHGSGRHAV
jgi:hypothetical protein